jgi:hypothetical protein
MLVIGGLAVAAFSVASCEPAETGVTGIGVDAKGGLVGYVQVCGGRLDGATLYETDGATLGEWKAPAPVKGFARWPLGTGDAWTSTQRYKEPAAGNEYNLYGWTSDNSSSSAHVTFRLRDLRGVTPGVVVYGDASNGFKRVTESQFRRKACADL